MPISTSRAMASGARSLPVDLTFPSTTMAGKAKTPCLAISSLVLGLTLLADGLREISIRD